MADFFWFSDEQWARIEPLLPQDTRGMPRVDDRRVLSGIVHALKSGGRWGDCPEHVYGPKKTLLQPVPALGRARRVGAHLRPACRGRGRARQTLHRQQLGARQAKAGRIIAIDTNPSKFELARQFGATECINPKDHDKPIQQVLIEMTGWGIDHTFECIGNVHVMRAALESAHRGWGQSIVIGVAGAGEEISTRPFQLVTGRVWKGSAFGGVKGRTELPGMVEDAMRGDIDLAPFVTHTMGLEEINEAFELMHEGKSIRSVIHY